jgi:hypothetical protein
LSFVWQKTNQSQIFTGAEQMFMETWQWIKAPSAVGKSDWQRQNKDRAMCLISRARAAHQQLFRLQQCNELTVILETTGESQPGISPLYLVLVREASTK